MVNTRLKLFLILSDAQLGEEKENEQTQEKAQKDYRSSDVRKTFHDHNNNRTL